MDENTNTPMYAYDKSRPTVVVVSVQLRVPITRLDFAAAYRAINNAEHDDFATAVCAVARDRVYAATCLVGITADQIDVVEVDNMPRTEEVL